MIIRRWRDGSDEILQVSFIDWLDDRLADGDSRLVAVGETFVGSFSHENPFHSSRVVAAFNDFAVVTLQFLGHFHVGKGRVQSTNVELAFALAQHSSSVLDNHSQAEVDGIVRRRLPLEGGGACSGHVLFFRRLEDEPVRLVQQFRFELGGK